MSVSRGNARRFPSGPTFSDKRNTSRVFPVPPNALPDALRALKAWRESNPVHARWVAAGAPNLTHDQHRRAFGHDYRKEPK